MSVSVTMPQLGESVTEGTVTRWLKHEGDRVAADEPLLEVSTDKVDTEIPSPASGVVSRILVGVDEVAPVGSELAIIAEDVDSPRVGGGVEPVEPESRTMDQPESETPAPEAATSERVAASEATVVTMPALGESVTEGTITRWLKSVGDPVTEDEPLLEVSTDKVDTEIPSPVTGVLLDIKVAEDETAAVGAELAVISAAAPEAKPATAQTAPPAVPAKPAPTSAAPRTAAPTGGYVTPLVRKLAAERGVDLATVSGTGQGGRIRRQDVLDAAERAHRGAPSGALRGAPQRAGGPVQPAPARRAEPLAPRGRTEKLSRMRAVIARRMVESLQISAQLTTVVEVDITRIAKLRDRVKDDFARVHGVRLSFLPFFALATVEALRVHSRLNASIDTEAGTVTYHDAEHLAIAVDTDKGLMVPVIRNAGDLNISGLARRIADLAERARTSSLTPDDASGGTFTLTNTGSRGALFDTPIINQPQVGILGTGAVVKRAVVVDDPDLGEVIAPRSMVYLSLSYDHRLVDGADAVRFLGTIKERLSAGEFESALGLG